MQLTLNLMINFSKNIQKFSRFLMYYNVTKKTKEKKRRNFPSKKHDLFKRRINNFFSLTNTKRL